MRSIRTGLIIGGLMLAASVGAVVVRQGTKVVASEPTIALEAVVPKQFGDWRHEPHRLIQVVNPQLEQKIKKDYSQTLTRTYANRDGYLVMLSLAYASAHEGPLKLHKPETCYSGEGFTVHRTQTSLIATTFGEIPVRRLFTSKGSRDEPVTYWLRVGDKPVQAWQSKLVEVSYALTGRSRDGLLFRISSLDSNQARANRIHDQFVNQLLLSVSPEERQYLSGLGKTRAN